MCFQSQYRFTKYPLGQCVRITATAPHSDMIKFTPTNFAVCYFVVLLSLPGRQDYEYTFVQWLVPADLSPGLDWDFYFYHV